MTNKILKNSSLITAAALFAFAGQAASAGDGFYVSGSITATDLNHNINRNTGLMDSASVSSSVSDTNVGLRLGAGYKTHLSDKVFVAVEGFYAFENAETESLNGMLVSRLELDASYGADLRLGYDITEEFSLYALAGVTALDFDNNTAYTFAPPMQELSATETGFTYGIGGELQMTDRMSIIAEYRLTKDVDFTPNPDRVGELVNENLIDHGALRVGVNFSF